MLRIVILSAWAKLQAATHEEPYLIAIVNPHKVALASLWVACIRDFASVKVGTEVHDDVSAGALDSSYANLGKDTLLPVSEYNAIQSGLKADYAQFYLDAWPHLLRAVTEMMEVQDPNIFSALGAQINSANTSRSNPPASFFYILLGLVFEVLTTSGQGASITHNEMVVIALRALTCLMQNQLSGDALADPTLFEEIVNIFYRMALTEPLLVQVKLLQAISIFSSSLPVNHGSV